MNAREIIGQEGKYLVNTYTRPEVVFERGQGAHLYDLEGNGYLDFASGICVNALGHSDPDWVESVCAQLRKLVHVSNLYHTAQNAQLAAALVEKSFAQRVYFSNSGAEANEAALKFAKKWAKVKHGDHKTKVACFEGGFHGRTAGALSLTHKKNYRSPFEPLMPGVQFAPFNDIKAAKETIDDETCAVFVEPVQGEGGVHPAREGFLRELKSICEKRSALLIFDEIQCGLGRTGTLWAHDTHAVTPHLMTLAKPLAGGLPIGATLMLQDVADVLGPGDHGSTFAGGPVVCTAALNVLERLSQESFLRQVRHKSDLLFTALEALKERHPKILKEARGSGLLVGVETTLDDVAPIIEGCRKRGLLVIKAGPKVLRLTPPLTITEEEIGSAVETLETVLKKIQA